MMVTDNHPTTDHAAATRELFARLFARRVPEVANGDIRIVNVARDVGYYAKVAVAANVDGLNAAASCIGPRGARIHDVEASIPGERISVVSFDPDPVRYVANALDVDVESVEITSGDLRDIRAVVSVNRFAEAIGKRARNVRLASELTGWHIAICTARCTSRRHIHPRFDTAARQSVWDLDSEIAEDSVGGGV